MSPRNPWDDGNQVPKTVSGKTLLLILAALVLLYLVCAGAGYIQ